jgi:hypothetical protein
MMRIIEDVTEGIIGEVWGEARFTPDADGLTCREEGVMRFRGADYHAERVSLWRFPESGRIEVRYADGRPFHDFDIGRPQAVHNCGADRYSVSYSFGTRDWTSVWEVSGPGKAYRMTTRYRRPTPR